MSQFYADLLQRNFQISYSDIYTAGHTNSASDTSFIIPNYYHCHSSTNVYYMCDTINTILFQNFNLLFNLLRNPVSKMVDLGLVVIRSPF